MRGLSNRVAGFTYNAATAGGKCDFKINRTYLSRGAAIKFYSYADLRKYRCCCVNNIFWRETHGVRTVEDNGATLIACDDDRDAVFNVQEYGWPTGVLLHENRKIPAEETRLDDLEFSILFLFCAWSTTTTRWFFATLPRSFIRILFF